MKEQLEKAKKFSLVNKKLLLITGGLVLGFVAYNSFNTKYHKKEIQVLEEVIEQKEEQFQEVVAEKEKLQDSSNYFEELANKLSIFFCNLSLRARMLSNEDDD